ncbi:MAG TPA: methyltransferase [Bryobacteraceae bacterium]|nr:methyltransferase [Bryobacteraceae bacterium]
MMPEASSAQTAPVPVEAQLLEMMLSQVVSRLVNLAAVLKLPDHLAPGPKTAEELAALTATSAPVLYRVLRTLSSFGLFTEDAAHRFSLLPLGQALQTGTPSHAAALMLSGEFISRSLDHLLHSVQTGETGFQKAFGQRLFDWLAAHPTEAGLFNATMVGVHGMEPAAVADAYDFSIFDTVADIGGSTGNMLTTILGRHARPRGILFDMPHVVRDAPALIRERGLTDRIRIEAGSFFESVPSGADAYVLSHVIHDWTEQQCLTILGNCRRAMKPGARVLLVEMVLPSGDVPHLGKILDMLMLVTPGGEERTAEQYGPLLEKAGLRMTGVISTASPVSIVEAVLS